MLSSESPSNRIVRELATTQSPPSANYAKHFQFPRMHPRGSHRCDRLPLFSAFYRSDQVFRIGTLRLLFFVIALEKGINVLPYVRNGSVNVSSVRLVTRVNYSSERDTCARVRLGFKALNKLLE